MVTACLGLPALNGNTEQSVAAPASSLGHDNLRSVDFDSLTLLQESTRRTSFSVDHWQQHTIRTVIRHLTFAMSPPVLSSLAGHEPLKAQHLALLDSLSLLLTDQGVMPRGQDVRAYAPAMPVNFSTVHWIRQGLGIRAGPSV